MFSDKFNVHREQLYRAFVDAHILEFFPHTRPESYLSMFVGSSNPKMQLGDNGCTRHLLWKPSEKLATIPVGLWTVEMFQLSTKSTESILVNRVVRNEFAKRTSVQYQNTLSAHTIWIRHFLERSCVAAQWARREYHIHDKE